jgi:hypothetical protein
MKRLSKAAKVFFGFQIAGVVAGHYVAFASGHSWGTTGFGGVLAMSLFLALIAGGIAAAANEGTRY